MASEECSPTKVTRRCPNLASILLELQKKETTNSMISQSKTKPGRISTGAEVVIAVMGVTGAGKGSFISRTTGDTSVQIGSGLRSGTNHTRQALRRLIMINSNTRSRIIPLPARRQEVLFGRYSRIQRYIPHGQQGPQRDRNLAAQILPRRRPYQWHHLSTSHIRYPHERYCVAKPAYVSSALW